MSKIIKRNGKKEDFDITKIIKVLQKADSNTPVEEIKNIALFVADMSLETTEDVRRAIEEELIKRGKITMARNYIVECYKNEQYRERQKLDSNILNLINRTNKELMNENANKNPTIISTQRDLIAGEVNKDICTRYIFPKDVMEAHNKGAIHIHDLDYSAQHMTNCCLVNLEDMLQNGTCISGVRIDKPKSLRTAATVASQISASLASSQYGGQSMSLSHLAPFVDISRQKYRDEVREENKLSKIEMTDDQVNIIAEQRVKKEIKDSIQTLNYQWSTLQSTNGQSPFITLFLYLGEIENPLVKKDLALLIEEIFKQRIKGFKNRQGYWIAPTFPKLIYVLEEDNISENAPYYYLTKLAAECITKRMVPDLISEKIMKKMKVDENGDGHCYPAMGCRSFLTPYLDPKTKKPKYYGRFNLGVVSLNLAYIAYESKGNIDKFWELLEHYSKLAFKAQMARVNNLKVAVSDVAPILWQDGALARLSSGEPINKLFYDNYATISLGYMGVYETVKYLTGLSHTDERSQTFALDILKRLEDYCDEWYRSTRLRFSLYGTPGESLTGKFSKAIQRDFDPDFKSWVTNSFHVDVEEEINAFDKLSIESKFQEHSQGGVISYVEVPNLQKNPEVIITLMKFMYNNIMYAEINTKLDICGMCGYEGEINLVEGENGEYYWQCPNCLNTDSNTMTIIRRVCGYLGYASNGINHGRLADIAHRALHI